MVKSGIRCYGCDFDYTEGFWLEIEDEEPIFYCRECADKANIIGQPGVYEHDEEEEKMRQKLTEIFDLEWIRDFAEKNIDNTEWIEEDYDGEKRKILLIETLVTSQCGAYIPGMVLELFGQAEGYDLEDPYNYEVNATIHDTLMYWEDKINDCLNELLPSKGRYYVGYHEADGSYCLFYEEYVEEEEQV